MSPTTGVTSDHDIYRTAHLLIKQHGAEAPVHAAMRADAMLEKDDLDGHDLEADRAGITGSQAAATSG